MTRYSCIQFPVEPDYNFLFRRGTLAYDYKSMLHNTHVVNFSEKKKIFYFMQIMIKFRF